MSEQHQKQSQSYRDLIAWQKSLLSTKGVCRLTSRFPNEEKFGLISRRRRATFSILSNLAEGQAPRTTGEFIQFISHAELDTQLTLAVELGFCSESDAVDANSLIQELRKMLNALRRFVSTHNS